MKKMIAIVLIAALVAGVFYLVNPITPVYAEEYRNGFLLTPVHYDTTGVYTDTGFLLKTKTPYTVEQMEEMLRLLGGSALTLTQKTENEFLVTPDKELDTNSLYTFTITTEENETITWTFQTRRDFSVLGALPAHQSSYVPVNSGIEIYFSHTDFGKVERYFEITPEVEGRFETNGYTAVFVPKELEAGTLYTVTIKKGLPLDGSTQQLTEDYVFAFETEPAQDDRTESKGSLYFRNMLMEFGTQESPLIPVDLHTRNSSDTEAVVKTTLYRYKNLEDFTEAVETKFEQPHWAYSSLNEHVLDTDTLTEVLSFDQSFDLAQWQERFLAIPEPLSKGFYLIESTCHDLKAQVLVQVTDLCAYLSESDTKTIIWVNSLKNGEPVDSAQINAREEQKSHFTNASGVALFDTINRGFEDRESEKIQYFTIRSENETLLLLNSGYRPLSHPTGSPQDYWRYFQTDRTLYKPDDHVQFWGFIRERFDGTSPEKLTVEIAEGGYWGIPEAKFLNYYLPSIQKPLVSLAIPCEDGFFEGGFQLPKLSPGGYQITVKIDDQIVNSHYFSVENYVKPAYKMVLEKDKNAIFLGETANFTIRPSFFDGTLLPSLDITYNMGGYPFETLSGTLKTETDGKLTIPFTAKTNDAKAQGEHGIWFNANASLPESGMTSGNEHVRVFINDMHGSFKTETDENGEITLKAALNHIELDRLNNPEENETVEYNDYLGEPVAYKTIAGTIVYHTYDKIEDGEEYDYINKVVNKRYRYEERRENIQGFSFTTGEDGTATETFKLPHPNEGYYTAELIWQDGNRRVMSRNIYLSNRNINYPGDQYDWYHLESDKDKYRLEDDVIVTLKNNDKTVSPESVLFMESQRGITAYRVQNKAEYKTHFTGDSIPNFYIHAVYFNGKNYVTAGSRNITYDTDEMKIDLVVETDEDAYRPGDTVTLKITANDEDGKPVAARVNLCLIDEAMLELSSYSVNVLDTLYQWLDRGMGYSYSTHGSGSFGGRVIMGAGTARNDGMMENAVTMDMAKSTAEAPQTNASYEMDDVRVRSEFKDTALFKTTMLSKDGTGTVSFKLPDNVTSWRVTLAGISPDLYGGTGEAALKVTLPFFINDSLNTTYLTGDQPYIGVSGYGNDLTEGESITWKMTCPQIPDYMQTVTGKAFERSNIPLWEMEPGVYDIEIKAMSENGLADGIKRTIHVADTYHEIEKAVTSSLETGMSLTGGTEGLTTLLFTDEGRGKLIPVLYGLLYSGGSRLDQKYTAYQAKLLLNEMTPETKNYRDIGETDLAQYQKPDGGFGILPYSESDLKLSALLSHILKDEAGGRRLKQYFYSLVVAEPGRINAPALYGLAVMGEPVLVDLNKAVQVTNLTLEDCMYLALAFDSLGETTTAQRIYHDRVTPVLEHMDPYIRVQSSDNTDTILKDTALAAVLASRLDLADKDGLFLYMTNHHSKKELMNAEKLLYVMEEYSKLPAIDAEFTYEYDGTTYTEHLKDGTGITVTIPSTRIFEVKITDVSGDVSVVSVFKSPLTESVEPDENLKISRTYYRYNTGEETMDFKQNDIVKVVLDWNIEDMAMDSYYEITDFAPSGLKPIENPYQAGIQRERGISWWFRNTDGQKVTFNVYRDTKEKESLVYYARVVSPGTFKADSPIIQGTLVKDSMRLGESATLRISD